MRSPAKILQNLSDVTLACEVVPIVGVCRLIGVSLPDIPEGKSVKVTCPFGLVYHSDGGRETSFRVYPHSNSVYCFAGCGFYSTVGLYATAKDLDPKIAARDLLEMFGYKRLTVEERWDALVADVPTPADPGSLAEALKIYCARKDPEWEWQQFEQPLAGSLSRCLALLDKVTTYEEGQVWLDATKKFMDSEIERVARG